MSALDPEADITLNQASHGLSLIMDSDGTPVIANAPLSPMAIFIIIVATVGITRR